MGLTKLASACIISIVRLLYLKIAKDSHDNSWDSVPATYWTVVELNIGIVCACLPTLRPLLRHVFPSLAHQSENSSGAKDSHGERIVTIGGSSGKKRKPTEMYTLTTVSDAGTSRDGTSREGTSREDLRAMTYEVDEFARHPGKTSKLSTAIYGGRGSCEEAPGGYGRDITVTREIGMKESMKRM